MGFFNLYFTGPSFSLQELFGAIALRVAALDLKEGRDRFSALRKQQQGFIDTKGKTVFRRPRREPHGRLSLIKQANRDFKALSPGPRRQCRRNGSR